MWLYSRQFVILPGNFRPSHYILFLDFVDILNMSFIKYKCETRGFTLYEEETVDGYDDDLNDL